MRRKLSLNPESLARIPELLPVGFVPHMESQRRGVFAKLLDGLLELPAEFFIAARGQGGPLGTPVAQNNPNATLVGKQRRRLQEA